MDIAIQYEIVTKFTKQIEHEELRLTVKYFTDHPTADFYTAPTGRKCHGSFPGGLASHCINMALLFEGYSRLTDVAKVDKDLVLAGILLHDVGKIDAYKTLEDGKVVDTAEGTLKGHLLLSYERIADHFRYNAYTDESKIEHLLHIIASHHGKREWGAIQQPKTAEAVLVHQLDMLESRMSGLVGVAHGDRPAVLDGASFFNFAEVDLDGAD